MFTLDCLRVFLSSCDFMICIIDVYNIFTTGDYVVLTSCLYVNWVSCRSLRWTSTHHSCAGGNAVLHVLRLLHVGGVGHYTTSYFPHFEFDTYHQSLWDLSQLFIPVQLTLITRVCEICHSSLFPWIWHLSPEFVRFVTALYSHHLSPEFVPMLSPISVW